MFSSDIIGDGEDRQWPDVEGFDSALKVRNRGRRDGFIVRIQASFSENLSSIPNTSIAAPNLW